MGFLSSGFTLEASGRAFITEDELFRVPKEGSPGGRPKRSRGFIFPASRICPWGISWSTTIIGIAQYMGLVKLEVGGASNDFLHLAYKGGDKLYVPVDKFGSVAKYFGGPTVTPLDWTSWAAPSWERVKARVKGFDPGDGR